MLNDYFLAEEGYEIMSNEDGFCAYKYDVALKNFYIGHFYVTPDGRKSGESYKFYDQIRFRAKALGAENLVADVYINKHNFNEYTKKVLIKIKHGFKIIDVSTNCITMMKEL